MFLPTGAKMPIGPNAVVMLEYVKKINNSEIEIIRSVSPSENIIKKGEDFAKGKILIKSGKFIKPKDLAVFTSLNKVKIKVNVKPKISVLSTGDELIEPSNIKNTKTAEKSLLLLLLMIFFTLFFLSYIENFCIVFPYGLP